MFTVLMVLLSALSIFILICGNNPYVSEKISELFFRHKETTVQEQINTEPQTDTQRESVEETTAAVETEPVMEVRQEETQAVWQTQEETAQEEPEKSLKYPYYEMLDNKEKKLYNQMYENMTALETNFKPCVSVTEKQVQNAFYAVYNDHPELFWMDASYSYVYLADSTIASGRTVILVDLAVSRASGDFDGLKEEFERKADEIADAARKLDTDFEREKYVHDYLVDTIVYDETHYINQNAYSALVDGRCVCAGYARAFQYVMQKLDIPCYYVVGIAEEDHAWNIVGLDDGFYNVDVTWDDNEYVRYAYFNRTDAEFAESHTRTGLSVNLPECTATAYSQENRWAVWD